jgi:hypothetical protein
MLEPLTTISGCRCSVKKPPTSRRDHASNCIMHGEHTRALAVASAAIVLSVAGIPGLAQSNAVRWRTASSELTVSLAANAVGVYDEPQDAPHVVETPPNLTVPSGYHQAIGTMLERSPMFRRQCLRLAAASHLAVVVKMLHPNSGGARARTQIRRADGGLLIASVEINPYLDFTELLAHELEHVIEQLDGIDLAAKAAVARSGVRNCADGTFETSRAVRVGALVALEARRER